MMECDLGLNGFKSVSYCIVLISCHILQKFASTIVNANNNDGKNEWIGNRFITSWGILGKEHSV